MDHNYASSVLPSYLGVSQHEAARVPTKSQKKETTLINIRKRLRSAALTVAYERGLDSLTRIIDTYQVANAPPTTAFGRSTNFNRNGYGYHLYERTSSAKSVASSVSGVSTWNAARDLSPLRAPKPKFRRDRILSSVSTKSTTSTKSKNSLSTYSSRPSSYSIKDADILSLKSFSTEDSSPTRTPNSRIRKERIMSSISNKSTISTSSRPSSFSSREAETLQMFWNLNLNQIQELKERYSENSEFLVSIYEAKLRRRENKHKKTIETKYNDSNTKNNNDDEHEHRRNRTVTLSDVSAKEEDVKSAKSVKSYKSIKTESSSSTLTPRKFQETDDTESKNRKVGFNLKVRKKEVRLPPIPPPVDKPHAKRRKPKSILKRQDSNLEQDNRTTSQATTGSHSIREIQQRSKQNIDSPRLQLPKLTPVPPSATPRKQAVSFKRATFNNNFKCSKEFEAAFKDFGNMKNSPLRPLSRTSSRNESVRSSSRSSSKIELARASSRSSSKNESLKSETSNSTVTIPSLRKSKIRLSPLTPVQHSSPKDNSSNTPTLSKVKTLPRPNSKQVSDSSDSRSNSTITVSSIRKV